LDRKKKLWSTVYQEQLLIEPELKQGCMDKSDDDAEVDQTGQAMLLKGPRRVVCTITYRGKAMRLSSRYAARPFWISSSSLGRGNHMHFN
jgi:hypothetical protein